MMSAAGILMEFYEFCELGADLYDVDTEGLEASNAE